MKIWRNNSWLKNMSFPLISIFQEKVPPPIPKLFLIQFLNNFLHNLKKLSPFDPPPQKIANTSNNYTRTHTRTPWCNLYKTQCLRINSKRSLSNNINTRANSCENWKKQQPLIYFIRFIICLVSFRDAGSWFILNLIVTFSTSYNSTKRQLVRNS